MTTSPLFSIVIPAYNYAETLPRAVASVMEQAGDDYELLVVNDGSTDSTAEVLKELSQQFGHSFRYHTKENGGLASTRNYGIKHTQGDFLIFLDADDEMIPDALAALREHISQQPETRMIIGSHYAQTKPGKDSFHKAGFLADAAETRLAAYLLDKTLAISNGATAMHRDIFSGYQYPEHFRNSEDIAMFAYTLSNFPCTTIDFPIARIYKHDDSLRNNIHFANAVGTSLIDEVFDERRIPHQLQKLKAPFAAQRNLSLFRTYFLAGHNAKALSCYFAAWQYDRKQPRKWSYQKKAIRAFIALIAGKSSPLPA